MTFLTTLAQANGAAPETGDGSGVVAFFVIVGFLWAICAACNKKKSYKFGGRIDEV